MLNNKFFLFIIIIIISTLLLIFVISRGLRPKSITDKYNDTSYDSTGMPNGGILITMLDTTILYPNYAYKSNKCLNGDPKGISDITDISSLLDRLVKSGAGTNCYALDTTYFRTDLPNYVFGPYPGADMNIGIILDTQKLWNYIACMFPIDSGSIARYNCTCQGTPCDESCTVVSGSPTPDVTASWIDKDGNSTPKAWNDYLATRESSKLAMAGCGKIQLEGNVCGLQKQANSFIVNTDAAAKAQTNKTKTTVDSNVLLNNWVFGNDNLPYSKYQWKYWVESVKYLYHIADNMAFTELQKGNKGNGYRENEVDIIVPNEHRNCNGTDPCKVTQEFQQVWLDSILGVFTNAKTNCSNNPDIAKDAIYGCSTPDCCCSEDMSKKIVQQIVKNFNKNLAPGRAPIKGYTLETLNIVNFNWIRGTMGKLNLKPIM